MIVSTALTLNLGSLNQPVVTSYDLGLILFRLYRTKHYKGESLDEISKDLPDRTDYKRQVQKILESGVIHQSNKVKHRDVYFILGKESATPEEIVCCIDPFAYLSHMSAMEWHGLTDRIPKILFISSPPEALWRKFALERMQKDFGEDDFTLYKSAKLPVLQHLRLEKISGKTVNRYASSHRGSFTLVKGSSLRVSSIGRTFLDMIREPDLCGGIYHVLEIYKEHAKDNLNLILNEIDRHGTKIDKVRAGYILEERVGISNSVIDAWMVLVKRGGSRKLYAHNEYSPVYSEKWCLSINIEE